MPLQEYLLHQHMEGIWSCMFELTQYMSTLQVCPLQFAGLACPTSSRCHVGNAKAKIMQELQHEWELVISAESDTQAAATLHRTCPQVRWQCYRELMTLFEQEEWQLSSRALALVQAWIPKLNSSANVEDIFNSMADSISRSTKTDLASMSNLQAVQIRAYQQKIIGEEHQARGIELKSHDFEGCEVRGLRTKLFLPSSFTGSNLSSPENFRYCEKNY